MINGKKILGVLGGLGPAATTQFMNLIIEMSDAASDQEHMDMVVFNAPSIPDRTGYILDNAKPCPQEPMIDIGNRLAAAGADFIAIPCMTAHYFYDAVQKNVEIPIIHAIRETAMELQHNGITKVGLMATDGTVHTRLFHNIFAPYGIEVITPSEKEQENVMHIVYDNVKAGKPADANRFMSASRELFANGAQRVVLGCTELPLVKQQFDIGPNFVDPMEILAQKAMLLCDVPIKAPYRDLISK